MTTFARIGPGAEVPPPTVRPVLVAELFAEGERMPVYVHVIDHPDARVLVDTAGGRPIVIAGDTAVFFGELDEPRTEGQRLVRALDPELVWLSHTNTNRGDRRSPRAAAARHHGRNEHRVGG